MKFYNFYHYEDVLYNNDYIIQEYIILHFKDIKLKYITSYTTLL